MRTGFLAFLIVLCLPATTEAQSSRTDLDQEIERLLTAVGGREAWKDAKGFTMTEVLYTDPASLPVVRTYWVDFERPRIMERATARGLRQTRALNGDSGWTERNGELTIWDQQSTDAWRSFWPGIPTRVFHLLAAGDRSVEASWRDGVIDFHIDGRRVVWIAADENGVPVAYGRDERHSETHFLGKHEEYGNTVLWTEATEPGGNWRVVMVDYELLTEPHAISFEPPSSAQE